MNLVGSILSNEETSPSTTTLILGCYRNSSKKEKKIMEVLIRTVTMVIQTRK